MFKQRDTNPYDAVQAQGGPHSGAVLLPLSQVLPGNAARILRNAAATARVRIGRICAHADLAENIGSAHWFRGFGTMLGLAIAAVSFWPDFSSVEAATATRIDDATRDEFRSQMIMPLAMGAESGRRMGPTAAVLPLASVPERPRLQFTTTLGQGDSFGRMLQRAGVGADDAARVSELVAGSVSLGQVGPGTQFDLTLGRRSESGGNRPLEALKFRARFDLDLAIRRYGSGLALEQRAIAIDSTPLRITGTVGHSLYRSARAAGAPVKAIQQYLQVIDQHAGLGDLAETDRFDIILGYKRSAKGESEAGNLLYAGLDHGGQPRARLLRWGGDGQFFEASGMGQQQQAEGSFAPVAGHITSYFGMRRHPILGYARLHGGVDFGARWGSPIFAASSGVVSYAGRHGGHGNFVRLDHGGGMGTGYAHMSRIAVSPGTRVAAGQVIGYVGSTGLSTGPHLHFEAYQNGQRINPLSLRFTTRAAVDKQELSAFKARLAALMAIEPGSALNSLAPRQADTHQH